MIGDWKRPKDIQDDLKTPNYLADLAGREHGDLERLFERSGAQVALLKTMRADKGNPQAQLILRAYDATHPVIAAGNPPLTRRASDAWAELFCFLRNQSGGPRVQLTDDLKEEFARTLKANWAAYSSADRESYAKMPQHLAAVRLVWVTGKDADRQKILAQWQPMINPGDSNNPEMAVARMARDSVNALLQRDPNTVSDQELMQGAKDAEVVGSVSRRAGTPQDVANAALWEDWARVMRAGKAAYVQRFNDDRAKAAIVEEWQKTRIINNALLRRRIVIR